MKLLHDQVAREGRKEFGFWACTAATRRFVVNLHVWSSVTFERLSESSSLRSRRSAKSDASPGEVIPDLLARGMTKVFSQRIIRELQAPQRGSARRWQISELLASGVDRGSM